MIQPPAHESLVKSLLDPEHPATDPVAQALQVAMSGFGYNFYDARNVARANDLVVRERASGLLLGASGRLEHVERAFREEYIPPPSREQPFPDPELAKRLRDLAAVRHRISETANRIITLETPATDSVWFRVRTERDTLVRLVSMDVALIQSAQAIDEAARSVTPEQVRDGIASFARPELDAIDAALDARRALLSIAI